MTTTQQGFTPTDEQTHALDLFTTGQTLALEARAGTGKSSTLALMAHSTRQSGLYAAFNKSIVGDMAPKLPGTVTCRTMHSLAYGSVGTKYRHRLNGPRLRSNEIARILQLDPFVVTFGTQKKVLQPGYLGGLVMQAIGHFCNSADPAPTRRHVPYVEGIDMPHADGSRGWHWNRELAEILEPALTRAWADITNTNGRLRFSHDCYFAIWAMSQPTLGADFLLVDEAQDQNARWLDVVFRQDAQIVMVGDSAQNIYEWRGSIDAMTDERITHRAPLSQSFRFGPAVAQVANRVLDMLGSAPHVRGSDAIASIVGPIAEPDAILCRTNAGAVDAVLAAQQAGQRPHLVGGGSEVVSFAKAAQELMTTGHTWHQELSCFDSWGEVTDYVQADQLGGELRLMVSLVEKYSVPTILRALDRMVAEDAADVIVSTAHKAKGREFDSVRLAGDFPTPKDGGSLSAPELRLLYVAATRAKRELDVSAVSVLTEQPKAPVLPVAPREPAPAVSAVPKACPDCGRTDVVRPATGLVGVHDCASVKR